MGQYLVPSRCWHVTIAKLLSKRKAKRGNFLTEKRELSAAIIRL